MNGEAVASPVLPKREAGGLGLTEYGFGTAGIARLDRASAERVLGAAWDGGVRYFDTAPHYGRGRAERHLGAFLSGRSGHVLSSKVGRWHAGDGEEITDYTRDGILRAHEQSLARLGLGRIDILFVHDIGRMAQGVAHEARLRELLESGLAALEELKGSGAVRAVGLGVNEVAICLDLLPRMEMDAILLAGRYTLLDRSAEAELLPALAGRSTRLVVGGLFNGGILLPDGPRTFDYAPAPAEVIGRARRISDLVHGAGASLAEVATNFPLDHEAVASVLLGTVDPETTCAAVAAHGRRPDPDLLRRIAPHALTGPSR